jgi:dTDP-4-amino-4,6-dideoxygalactose transaminase
MIPYGRQSISKDDIAAVIEALQGEFLTTGPLVQIFEQKIENAVGAPTVSVSSGTAALHCAYRAIEVGPGDEIITPPITFVATQATAVLFGARIVFADVSPDTANINPDAVLASITPRTKAIVAVDYAGHPADMSALRKIADSKGLYLIEDAAHSIGSTYFGKSVGSLADITTFSFFPTKNMTTGEGGAVSSMDPNLLERARKFARQGIVREASEFRTIVDGPWHQEVQEFGLNYRLPDVLCALGIQQISRLEEFKTKRREIFFNYVENLSGIEELRLPTELNGISSNWHLFPIRVPSTKRRDIFEALRASGIGVQVNYLPAYRHPAFAKFQYNPSEYPASELFYSEEISLPMYAGLSKETQDKIIQSLKTILKCV